MPPEPPRPPRLLPPRERAVVERVPVDLRALVLRVVLPFAAPPLPLLLAVLERLPVVPDFADRELVLFARVVFAFVPVDREPVERALPALLRDPVVLRELELREPLLPEPSSSDHLPDITRCAASATASAISDPSRVALDITVFAAWLAESAASIPASRIFLRADGLALIAAAAAASPAASISLLIAAFAILSTVVSFEPRELDEELDFRPLDFAIANLPVRIASLDT